MKVKALKPILYRAENFTRVAEKGEEIEMDKETFQWRKSRGEVEAVKDAEPTIEDDLVVSEGLPALDEIPISKGKKK